MKAESFFIGPNDEDTQVNLPINLAELKYIHGILVDCCSSELKQDSASNQLENMVLYLKSIIVQTQSNVT